MEMDANFCTKQNVNTSEEEMDADVEINANSYIKA